MLLTKVIKELDCIKTIGDLDKEISGIAYDSREVADNFIFVAISGFTVDGHDFIEKAIENGANVIIAEKDVFINRADVTFLKVKDSRKALAKISSNYYNNPTKKINMIGITGTNGKTSTSFLIKSIFEQAKKPIDLIGTIGSVIGKRLAKTKNTTPESLNLQQMFSEMVDINTQNCIMEVSSHALSLDRVAECDFNTGIYTNLTPDHLELHNSMEEYFHAKAKLFKMTKDYNIINIDDEYGRRLVEEAKNLKSKTITYGIDNKADIYATSICYSADFTSFVANTPKGSIEIKVNFPGKIYIYNSLAAIACAYCNDIELKDIQKGIEAVKDIKGRFEVVYKDKDYKIIVDFAHTEDGLEKALSAIKPFTKGRLILVFGVYAAPGEKGRAKRYAMGKVAAKYSDIAVVTSDNPKDQDPNSIIKEIVESIKEHNGTYVSLVDRKEAIRYAIEISKKDDIIFVAGKGHETSQKIGKIEVPFNETEIITEIIKSSTKKTS
ncbi:UDP-N-acetylmuramoyl-L-alanyl-D-glutamate--2,6-diaminopimelate ligase [Proteiniborus sp. MB09-C3]|uniref:UDP-N-acetylmuramoyl-L-alanyl-D-glutamate--2, 6-diaminopimelate ligase n=1 Tax=Proteiniborus sp. MB09-C3 TaxID=3050072 RepID=UPI0025572662|nr:UDP-N-acetylmuramoyl-L-alanyl-D-glutamate--2,6-diaminopimelate ligase [Proteiniborus sp. MB09-C3]WIV13330.1 UDP-N-acetylmuramoyl-L-alanyl-D-glutamate--2,6-diaminopimelate ligase [Proteiniborus sp. MB09-C3]